MQMGASAMRPGASAMQMGGGERFGQLLLDQLEWRPDGSDSEGAWDVEGWYGGDRDRLWLRTEGERTAGVTENARGELLAGRAIGPWWNVQAGVREDFGSGPPRTWAAFGIEGLAPFWTALEATLYAGEGGRTAARLKGEYDLLLTQRLILQPEIELDAYSRSDPGRRLQSGLAQAEAGLRLRFEIRRELAPYIGILWTHERTLLPAAAPGAAAAAGADRALSVDEAKLVVGIRVWL